MQQTGLFNLHNPADRAICLRLRTEQHGGGHVGPSTGLAGTMAVLWADAEIEACARDMLDEIRNYTETGVLPRYPETFSEIHDHIDANELGCVCDDAGRAWFPIPWTNEAQCRVDRRLKARARRLTP